MAMIGQQFSPPPWIKAAQSPVLPREMTDLSTTLQGVDYALQGLTDIGDEFARLFLKTKPGSVERQALINQYNAEMRRRVALNRKKKATMLKQAQLGRFLLGVGGRILGRTGMRASHLLQSLAPRMAGGLERWGAGLTRAGIGRIQAAGGSLGTALARTGQAGWGAVREMASRAGMGARLLPGQIGAGIKGALGAVPRAFRGVYAGPQVAAVRGAGRAAGSSVAEASGAAQAVGRSEAAYARATAKLSRNQKKLFKQVYDESIGKGMSPRDARVAAGKAVGKPSGRVMTDQATGKGGGGFFGNLFGRGGGAAAKGGKGLPPGVERVGDELRSTSLFSRQALQQGWQQHGKSLALWGGLGIGQQLLAGETPTLPGMLAAAAAIPIAGRFGGTAGLVTSMLGPTMAEKAFRVGPFAPQPEPELEAPPLQASAPQQPIVINMSPPAPPSPMMWSPSPGQRALIPSPTYGA